MSTSKIYKVTKIMFSDLDLDGNDRRKRRGISDIRHNLSKTISSRVVNELWNKYRKRGKNINRDSLSIIFQILEVLAKYEYTAYHDIAYSVHLSNQLYDQYMGKLFDAKLIEITFVKAKQGQKKVAKRYKITQKGQLLLKKIYELKTSDLLPNDPFYILPMTLDEYTDYRKSH